jgi:predicted small secreted protein
MMKIAAWAMLMVAVLIGGCNTMQGAGRDIERGGEKIQDTAQDVKRKM